MGGGEDGAAGNGEVKLGKDGKPKFDRNDPEQMEALKKRDIKRYRKEMRAIKKQMRIDKGETVGVQTLPKAVREPEEIKSIKQGKFDMMK